MGKTLKYGSHDFPANKGFTGSATDKVHVRHHLRDGKVRAEHARSKPVRLAEGGGVSGASSKGDREHGGALGGGDPGGSSGSGTGHMDKAAPATKTGGFLNAEHFSQVGPLRALLDRLASPAAPDLSTPEGALQAGLTAAGALGIAPGMGPAVALGTAMDKENEAAKAAVDLGLVQGKVVDISRQGLSLGRLGVIDGAPYGNPGPEVNSAKLAGDIMSGKFSGGDISGYDKDTGGDTGRLTGMPKRDPAQQASQSALVKPLFDPSKPSVQPIIPMRQGGRPSRGPGGAGFNRKPRVGS